MRKSKLLFLLFFAAIIYSCQDNIVSECDVVEGDLLVEANFSSIQEKLFTPSCAQSGCHAGSEPQNNLLLTEGNAYDNLINVASRENGKKRVEPGNSAGSFLISKLKGEETTSMPPDGMLPRHVIDSIAVWIDNGALNN